VTPEVSRGESIFNETEKAVNNEWRRKVKMRLKDRAAIVTGAARGMGRGFALRLAEEGAKILAVDIEMEDL
jgi:hypothetical protein